MGKLTLKQQLFVEEFIKSKNATSAVLKVYNVKNKNVAAVIGSENLRKPNIKQYVSELLARQGYDAKRHSELILNGARATKKDCSSGEITPDWQARYKFIDMLNKISDIYPNHKTVTTKLSDDLESIVLRNRRGRGLDMRPCRAENH